MTASQAGALERQAGVRSQTAEEAEELGNGTDPDALRAPLGSQGLERLEPKGPAFDPVEHEAAAHEVGGGEVRQW